MNNDKITVILGNVYPVKHCLPIFSDVVIDYLSLLSKKLMKQQRSNPDIISFAYWCRKANLVRLKDDYAGEFRMGRGVMFHIAPSNVPINFAFSLAFALLAGNSSVVRVSEKHLTITKAICSAMKELFELEQFNDIREMVSVVSYPHDEEVTTEYCRKCQGRIIWGGDETVKRIRKIPLELRAVEIGFVDRYSIALISPDYYLSLSKKEKEDIAYKFYQDTYQMDQNACSSPQLICWKQEEYLAEAQKEFWDNVYRVVSEKYDFLAHKACEKYLAMCSKLIQNGHKLVEHKGNLIYRMEGDLSDISLARGRFGMFYEFYFNEIDELLSVITEKVQTCLTCGIDSELILEHMINNETVGIDRIVPFGEALSIGLIWDGYDVIRELSRRVTNGG